MSDRPSQKIISLEVGRFIAAFLVTASHEIGICIIQNHPPFGRFNVPAVPSVMFFFVLSGFVMMTAHGKDFGNIKRIPRFFWRRFCRIYPIYWLSLGLIIGIGLLFKQSYAWSDVFKAMTLWPFGTFISEVNGPAWTLRFEVAFYVMLGISLLPVFGRFFFAAWVLIVYWIWFPSSMVFGPLTRLLGLGWYAYLPVPLRWHFFGFPEMYFFAGLLAGFALKWRIPSAAAWALLAMAVFGALYSIHLAGDGNEYPTDLRTPFVALVFAAILFSLASLERNGALKLSARLSVLGAISYPLYLFHPMIIELFSLTSASHPLLTHNVMAPLYLAVMIVMSLLLAALVTFGVDIPMQRFLRAPTFRKPPPAAPPGENTHTPPAPLNG